ncbi:MAG: hypothetical protein MZV49_10610 [Rhodopseudomonas palustris]|nr:hypothetical protein [Rhodopseudomonas palustris]
MPGDRTSIIWTIGGATLAGMCMAAVLVAANDQLIPAAVATGFVLAISDFGAGGAQDRQAGRLTHNSEQTRHAAWPDGRSRSVGAPQSYCCHRGGRSCAWCSGHERPKNTHERPVSGRSCDRSALPHGAFESGMKRAHGCHARDFPPCALFAPSLQSIAAKLFGE